MSRRDSSQAPSLWGVPTTPDAGVPAQVIDQDRVSKTVSAPDTVPPAPECSPEPPALAEVAVAGQGDAPVKVGHGWGERLGKWARESFTPPEIWSEDRPSLSKQLAYAREGLWGPKKGWHRTAAQVAFWGVSFPTSAAAYAIEWVGERPSRWITALVLISLAYQLPYVPEAVEVLIRIPAWPITATWSLLGLSAS